jgi:alkylated DNA repair dioxygenase AlkB
MKIDLPDSLIMYFPGWIPSHPATILQESILSEAAWRQEHIRISGNRIPLPRLTAWHGDPGCSYAYSGIKSDPSPWSPTMRSVMKLLSSRLGYSFNSLLINHYRSGADSVAWHSDDEPELGPTPTIASISLGSTRRFSMKHKTIPGAKWNIDLAHGDLLIMAGATQSFWLHQIPKTAKPTTDRINLTFRSIETSVARA